jgi:hypothetical protein
MMGRSPTVKPGNPRGMGLSALLTAGVNLEEHASRGEPAGPSPGALPVSIHELGLTEPAAEPQPPDDVEYNAVPPLGQRQSMHEPSEHVQAAEDGLRAAGFGGPSADLAGQPPEPSPAFQRMSRGQRIPFGVREQKLAWVKVPGFHLHWFNDEPGRVARAQAAGYTHVLSGQGRNVATIVGTDRAGKPLSAFLMKLPQEWYDEDMAALESEQATILAAIKAGQFKSGQNAYVPQQGIKVDTGLRR